MSNRWIAFWFATMVFNILSLNQGMVPLGKGFTATVVIVSAWIFMAGFMDAVRPTQSAASAAKVEQPR